MKITEGLLGEHALSYALFDQVESIADDARTLEELVAAESDYFYNSAQLLYL